jgi:putative addiction module killer protein
MFRILTTPAFNEWFAKLRDRSTRVRIQARIDRLEGGNFGDWAPVGEGVAELRIHFGAGYRVYFLRRGAEIIVLLGGGDKASQPRDIAQALSLAHALKEEDL